MSDKKKTNCDCQIRKIPVFAEVHYERGRQAQNIKEYVAALRHFQEASKLARHEDPEYRFQEARTYEYLGDYDNADATYTRAIWLQPQNVAIYYYRRGVVRDHRGKYRESLEDLSRVIDLLQMDKPDSTKASLVGPRLEWKRLLADSFFLRGQVYEKLCELNNALKDYTQAIAVDDKPLPDAYYCRGLVYDQKKEFDNAIDDFTAALDAIKHYDPDAKPQKRRYKFYRGCSYQHAKKYDEAIKDFDAVCSKLNPHTEVKPDDELGVDALYHRGVARLDRTEADQAIDDAARLAEFDKSIGDFASVTRLHPKHMMAYRCRAKAYDRVGENKKAKEDYERAIALKPDYARVFHKRALKRRHVDPTLALKDLDEAIRYDDRFAEAYYTRGLLRRKIPVEIDKAIDDLEKAVSLQGDHYAARYHLGKTYEMIGRHGNAIEQYSEILEHRPDYGFVYEARGRAYHETGESSKAREDLKKAREVMRGRDANKDC